jgi:hypothetical protein
LPHTHQGVNISPIDIDFLMLSTPPSFTALSYKKMRAYENHFRVDDEQTNLLVTYDSSVASIFQQSQGKEYNVLSQIQYLGALNQILQLDYGPMSSQIVLFWCNWVKNGTDNKSNPTYKRDEIGFLLANFCHLLHEFDEPFVFLSQVQHVFFWNQLKTPWWKVVLGRELRSRWVVVDMYDDCIEMCSVVFGLEAPLDFLDLKK